MLAVQKVLTTYILRDYGGQMFNVEGVGTFTGGEINYIGVGATAGHYGLSPSGMRALVIGWNLNQYLNPFIDDGFLEPHNITTMQNMHDWAIYGLTNYHK